MDIVCFSLSILISVASMVRLNHVLSTEIRGYDVILPIFPLISCGLGILGFSFI